MKQYFAFYGDIYEPNGGMKDFIGDFELIDDAKAAIESARANDRPDDDEYLYCFCHIWDSINRKFIYEHGRL